MTAAVYACLLIMLPAGTPRAKAPPTGVPGRFRDSCTGCSLTGATLRCLCQPDPERRNVESASFCTPPGNVSGTWVPTSLDATYHLHSGFVSFDRAGFEAHCVQGLCEWSYAAANMEALPQGGWAVEIVFGAAKEPKTQHNGTMAPNCSGFLWSDGSRWVHQPPPPPSKLVSTSLSLTSCEGYDERNPSSAKGILINNTWGHLTCDWKRAPPPRVGALTQGNVDTACRYFSRATFISPQMPPPDTALLGALDVGAAPAGWSTDGSVAAAEVAERCCTACRANTDRGCQAWTVGSDGRTCSLVKTTHTAYPTGDTPTISGYRLSADPASYCENMWAGGGGGANQWMDTGLADGTGCAVLQPVANVSFPRQWLKPGNGKLRGEAWFFYPAGNETGRPAMDLRNLTGNWSSDVATPPFSDTFGLHSFGVGFTGFSLRCLVPCDVLTHPLCDKSCDPANKPMPGLHGALWHTGVGVVGSGNNRTLHIRLDNNATLRGMLTWDFNEIAFTDGSRWRRQGAPNRCSCSCSGQYCANAVCSGESQLDVSARIQGQSVAVFIHGGDFSSYNGIEGGYSQLVSRVAKVAQMTVLTLDYRTVPAAHFPAPVEDVISALEWLATNGASELFLFGDSSGGTQVLETLLQLAAVEETREQRVHDVVHVDDTLSHPQIRYKVAAAATFSAWLDLTDSSPTYHTNRQCSGVCSGIGSQTFPGPPGIGQRKGTCAAARYGGVDTPANHPMMSPMHATYANLARMPPLLLAVGGNEQLLGETLMFTQRAQRAGCAAQAEIFFGMWHDFEESSTGCGAGVSFPPHERLPLLAGKEAIEAVAQFFRNKEKAIVACSTRSSTSQGETDSACADAFAPVHFHMPFVSRPPVAVEDC